MSLLSLSSTTNAESSDDEDYYCAIEGVKYLLEVEGGSEEETLFSAMKCSAEDIKLCALDEVVIDEMCYTVGYFHTKAHNETGVILIDETFGEPPSFILLLIDVFTHLHRESDSIWTSATRSPTEWRIGWAVCIWPFRWSIPMNVTIN
jgi:hypothetical protein